MGRCCTPHNCLNKIIVDGQVFCLYYCLLYGNRLKQLHIPRVRIVLGPSIPFKYLFCVFRLRKIRNVDYK